MGLSGDAFQQIQALLENPTTFVPTPSSTIDVKVGEPAAPVRLSVLDEVSREEKLRLVFSEQTQVKVPLGRYELVLSHGPEYEVSRHIVDARDGGVHSVEAELNRAINTDGWVGADFHMHSGFCLLYTSPSPRDATLSRMPSSA